MFRPRLTRPEAGNKFYIRKASGGYSPAIKGSPTDKDCDVLHNCVGYAWGRFHEIAGVTESLFDAVDAGNIYANAISHGLKVGTVPKLGALIVWKKTGGAGHVAVVEKINADGSIVISESGYNAVKPFWTETLKAPWTYGAGYTFLGFVYQPESGVPSGIIRKGDTGDSVRWMQTKLADRGYLRKSEIDGDFGTITLGALLAFQLESGLEVDGVCGPATKSALS